ncbi:MAG TPA: sugar transferase [Candidatus Sulfomarinibacteraceae bacterium]|nr:sugar transferase [Candidatus Sulfomarinibacteraceae bacterium]
MHTPAKSVQNRLESALLTPVRRADKAALSRDTQWRLFISCLFISDIIMAGAAFRLAYFVRFELGLPIFKLEVAASFPFYQNLAVFLIPLWAIIFIANGLYERNHLLGGTQEYARVFRAVSVGNLLVVFAGFLEPTFILARGWLILAWIFSFLFVGGARFIFRRIVYTLRWRGYFLTPTLIIGANEEGRSLAQQLLGWRTSGLEVLGFVDDKTPAGAQIYGHLHALGTTEHLDTLISRYQVEELVLATSALSRNDIVAIFKRYGMLDGLSLRLSSGLFEVITTGLEVKETAYTPLVSIQKARLTGVDRVLKLALDYGITIPGLILIAPIMALIALAIKLDSPGPVIYRRRVMGLNGCEFHAYKFRTMHINGQEILEQHPDLKAELAETHTLNNDPRITRVGAFLRRASLDELPQLFNVLRRQMSLVGPRMISPEEMEMYDEWGLNLLTVPPGITGLWQVRGRSDVSYDARVKLDMQYIRNWTIWLDVQLLMQTVPAVLTGRGAY